jgi:hypothetical protein
MSDHERQLHSLTLPICSEVITDIVSGVMIEIIGQPRVVAGSELGGVMFSVLVGGFSAAIEWGAREKSLAASNSLLRTHQ